MILLDEIIRFVVFSQSYEILRLRKGNRKIAMLFYIQKTDRR